MSQTPGSDEFGELILGPIEGAAYRIERADPRVRISGPLAREALGDRPARGARLVFRGTDRDVIYCIGAYHPDDDWYEAEWPD